MSAKLAKPPPLDPARLFVSVVIPCHDEIEALPALFEDIRRLPSILRPSFGECIFIDDGSTDGTVTALQDFAATQFFPCKVLGLSQNRGIGNALREAAPLVAGDVVVTYDADRPYPFEDSVRLIRAVADGADVATASPWAKGGEAPGVPVHRRILSRAASAAHRMRRAGRTQGVRTITCGFRAWRSEAFRACLPSEDGFAATAEMLLRALDARRVVVETPSILRARGAGASKMRALPTLWRHLRLIIGRRR